MSRYLRVSLARLVFSPFYIVMVAQAPPGADANVA